MRLCRQALVVGRLASLKVVEDIPCLVDHQVLVHTAAVPYLAGHSAAREEEQQD